MIDEKVLHKLADLARIQVKQEDIPARLSDFTAILNCIDELQKVEIPANFVPVAQSVNHARMDIVRPASSDTVQRIQEAFPENQMGRLKVPQVLKK